MTNLFLVAAGGALGTSLRYIASIFFKYIFYYSFVGTLVVNISGSFFIGLSIYLLQNKSLSQDLIRYFFIVGVLGSYTTFSAFSFETIELLTNNKLLLPLINIILSLVLCLIAAYVGLNINKILNWLKILKLIKKKKP